MDEVWALEALYRERYDGWNVQRFFGHYRAQLYPGETAASGRWSGEDGQAQGPSPAAPGTGALAGMLLHQDGSTHPWVTGLTWDLIVTMGVAQ